jgi:predicted  nucleic acid-binding Zn-ribbon protein
MNKDDNRRWGYVNITWYFLTTLVLVGLLGANPIIRENSQTFLILFAILVFLHVIIMWVTVHSNLAAPAKRLLQGILGESKDLPVNDKGPVGEAAQVFLHLKQDAEMSQINLKKANARIAELEKGEAELNKLVSDLRLSITESSNKAAELAKTTAEEISQLKKDKESADEHITNANRFIAQTEAIFAAVANSDYSRRYDDRFPQLFSEHFPDLSKKVSNFYEHIRGLSSKTTASKDELQKKAGNIAGLCSQLISMANNDSASFESISEKSLNIAANFQKNTELASKAADIAHTTKSEFQEGYNAIRQMNETMQEIDSMSGNIMNIIKSIDDISFQTQLLSLNASIEAARAGQMGRSFAVVASKVGELAKESKDSADETSTLLEGMIKRFHEGVEMSRRTASAMDKFLDGLNKIIDVVGETKDGLTGDSRNLNELSTTAQMVSGSSNNKKYLAEEIISVSAEMEDIFKSGGIAKRDVTPAAKPYTPVQKPAAAPAPAPAPRIVNTPAYTPAARPAQTAAPAFKTLTPAPKAALPPAAAKPATFTPAPRPATGTTAAPAADKKTAAKMVVSSIKSTGFDGSSEYDRKDFGKY